MAYWVSEAVFDDFEKGIRLANVCETRKGLATSDNNRFLRLWFEVNSGNISFECHSNKESEYLGTKWYPINKGGEYRRWYGNREYLINWENDGYEIRNFRDENGKLLSRPQNTQYNFKQALTWSKITSAIFSARFCECGFLFDDAAAICYHSDLLTLKKILGFLNSKCCQTELNILNPTINIQIGDIGNLSILKMDNSIIDIVDENITLSSTDWDSFETSWDFVRHPLVRPVPKVADAYTAWQCKCNERFAELKSNEEELSHCRDYDEMLEHLVLSRIELDWTMREGEL